MSRPLLIAAAAATSLVGVLGPGLAGAAPVPKYSVACVVGDTTVARWQRASLVQVSLTWSGPPGTVGTYPIISSPVSARPPHGVVTVGTRASDTGVPPSTATVTFTPANGGPPDVVAVDCS